jgi:hypothetical protein
MDVVATVRLQANAVPKLKSHRSDASRWKSTRLSPSVSRVRKHNLGRIVFVHLDDSTGSSGKTTIPEPSWQRTGH